MLGEDHGGVTVDSSLNWAKNQRDLWRLENAELVKGVKTTFDAHDGPRIDTARETLDDHTKRLNKLEALIVTRANADANRI